MKLEFNFEDLERQWKARQLDLFPWLDGLFALIRSRDSLINETRKRLSLSTQATMVQFLSSDDHDNAIVAREIIKGQQNIFPILLYSLEKIPKKNYPHRIMESLLDFDPAISFGYLLGYLYLRKDMKGKIFDVLNELFPYLNDRFRNSEDKKQLIIQIFHAIKQDLKERMPASGKLKSMEDFKTIRLDLKVMLLVFDKTWQGENAQVVEKEMQKIGQEVIISLQKFPFEFEDGFVLFEQLSEIIPYIALMRLKSDKSFLTHLLVKIKSWDLSKEEMGEIVQKTETAIGIIDQPEKTIHEILEQSECLFFLS